MKFIQMVHKAEFFEVPENPKTLRAYRISKVDISSKQLPTF